MCFFIPVDLVELEYLTGKEQNKQQDVQPGESHTKDMTFAFFVANFGYTKSDFERLTKKEIFFILKAWENKKVLDSQLVANAFYNAYCNANRGKKKPIKLWEKAHKKENINELRRQFDEVMEYEKTQSDNWIKEIYGNFEGVRE